MHQEKFEVNNENLSELLYIGSERAKLTKQKSIFVVGETRVGKSTLFNHLIGIRLKGVQLKGKSQVYYEPDFEGQAATEYTFKSVTILPNIKDITIKDETFGLQDMAGFNDRNRGFTGVFMVSYMLMKSFAYAEEAKFILVIEEANITISSIQDILKPFTNFVQMFVMESLYAEKQIIEKLMSSVVLLVTKSMKGYDIETRLNEIIEDLEDYEDSAIEQKLILLLLKNVLENKRFYAFHKAKKDQYSPNCTLFDEMAEKNWGWFPFKENKNMINIPFKRDFLSLKSSEQEKFKQFQKRKMSIFSEFTQVMKKFIDSSISQSGESRIHYGEHLQELNNFFEENDEYKDEKIIQTLSIEMSKPQTTQTTSIHGLQLLNKLTEANFLCSDLSELAESNQSSSEILRSFKSKISAIIEILMFLYCHNRKEEISFMKASFIFIQSIEEFAAMNDIEKKVGASAIECIKDSFDKIMPPMVSILVEFFKQCEPDEKNIDEVEAKLDDLLGNHIEDFPQPEDVEILREKQIKVKILRGDFQINSKQFSSSILSLNRALTCLVDQKKQYKELSEEKQRFFECKLIQIYSKLGKSLIGIKKFDIALQIFEKIGFVSSINNCYQKMTENENNTKKKYQIMFKHANFCFEKGRIQDSIKVYQNMNEIFYPYPDLKKNINEKIEENLLKLSQEKFTNYRQTLLDNQRFENDEQLINRVLEEQKSFENKLEKSRMTQSESGDEVVPTEKMLDE